MFNAYSKAKKFFKDEWNDNDIKIHSKCVIDCCKNIIKKTELNLTIFYIAGWVHDIGRKDNEEKHHEISLIYLEKFLKKYPEFKIFKEEISDCILNHRSSGNPKTIYGKIIQLADKLALQHKNWIKYIKENS